MRFGVSNACMAGVNMRQPLQKMAEEVSSYLRPHDCQPVSIAPEDIAHPFRLHLDDRF